MIRGRGQYSGPSKASPSTTCQKCLKKDNYECKATTQERPYKARPSRTQQLANPELVPKLSSDVPNDLLRKDGIADEQLASLEKERGRRRHSNRSSSPSHHSERGRSLSMTSGSVSTISTGDRSRSSSPRKMKVDDPFTSQRDSGCPSISPTRKRRRNSSTGSSSTGSTSSYAGHRPSQAVDRNTRRRRSFLSPNARGRGTRRRRTRSRSNSMDRSQIARHRTSMTPEERNESEGGYEGNGRRETERGDTQRSALRRGRDVDSKRDGDDRHSRQSRYDENPRDRTSQYSKRVPPPPPERRWDAQRPRSLSPFSKRLALTQSMNVGR